MSGVFQWRGGKYHLAPKIVPYLPKAKIYYEGFCGGASLFWEKPPHPVEVLNDLDGEVVNFYRVLQDPVKRKALNDKAQFTLYSRDEFRKALAIEKDPEATDVEQAWAFFVRQNQGFAGSAGTEGRWGRAFLGSEEHGPTPVAGWNRKKSSLEEWGSRLERVQIDHVDALVGIKYWDSEDTVMYLDPPYVPETRNKAYTNNYTHDCDLEFHLKLVDLLLQVKGKVVLSGYDSDVYKALEDHGWIKVTLKTVSMGIARTRQSKYRGDGELKRSASRIECLWIKGGRERVLFGGFSAVP